MNIGKEGEIKIVYEIAWPVPSLGVYKMRESAGIAVEARNWGNETCGGVLSLNSPERRLSICHVFVLGISWWAELSWEEVMGYVSHLERFFAYANGTRDCS